MNNIHHIRRIFSYNSILLIILMLPVLTSAFTYNTLNAEELNNVHTIDIYSVSDEEFVNFVLLENEEYFDYSQESINELRGSFLARLEKEEFLEAFNSELNITLRQKFWKYYNISNFYEEGMSECEINSVSGNTVETKGYSSSRFDINYASSREAALQKQTCCLYIGTYPECELQTEITEDIMNNGNIIINSYGDNFVSINDEFLKEYLGNRDSVNLQLQASEELPIYASVYDEHYIITSPTQMSASVIPDSDGKLFLGVETSGKLHNNYITLGSKATFFFGLNDFCSYDSHCYSSTGHKGSFSLSEGQVSANSEEGERMFTLQVSPNSQPVMLTDGFAFAEAKTYPANRESPARFNYFSDEKDGSYFKFEGGEFNGNLNYNIQRHSNYVPILMEMKNLNENTNINVEYDSSSYNIYSGKEKIDGELLSKSLGVGSSGSHEFSTINFAENTNFEVEDFGSVSLQGKILFGNSMILLPEESFSKEEYLRNIIENYENVFQANDQERIETSELIDLYRE